MSEQRSDSTKQVAAGHRQRGRLGGRVAIVTGGAVGVGQAIAAALANAGSRVAIVDVRDDVDAISATLRSQGLDVDAYRGDVADLPTVRHIVGDVVDRHGRIDVLVNNAGVVRATPVTDSLESAIDGFDAVMSTNLRGPYLFGRTVIPVMMAQRAGDIVNVATDHIHNCGWPEPVGHDEGSTCPWSDERRRPGTVGMDAYDASKWALNGLTQDWSKSLRAYNVRVNNLCIGATDSFMMRAHAGYADSDPPESLLGQWQPAGAVATVVVELILEGGQGRSGDNVGLWRGHPTRLPPPSEILNIPVGYDPAEARSSRMKKGNG